MGKYFVNGFTEYKSYQISNQYIRGTLLKSNAERFDFVIIDNSLDDDNYEKLSLFYTYEYQVLTFEGKEIREVELTFEGKSTKVLYVKNDKNTGYGSGANLAMKIAVQFLKPDYLIISNNDMVCLEDKIALDKVIRVFDENPSVGLVGVNNQNLDGSMQSPCRKVSLMDRWILPELFYPFSRKFRKRRAADLIQNPPTGIVYRVRGSFMILKPEAFIKSGGFDEKIFLYGEEPILAERLARHGYFVYHLNDIHMLHNHVMDNRTLTNDEIKKIKQRFDSEMYYYENYRNASKVQLKIARILCSQFYWRFKVYKHFKDRRERTEA